MFYEKERGWEGEHGIGKNHSRLYNKSDGCLYRNVARMVLVAAQVVVGERNITRMVLVAARVVVGEINITRMVLGCGTGSDG